MTILPIQQERSTMQVHTTRSITRALALLLTASLLTTCSDDSSSSNDDRGVFGDMADVFQSSRDTVFTANAAHYASAEAMKPYIDAFLDLNTLGAQSASAETSCLLDGRGGRTYTINGGPFTSVVDSLVPFYTARFRMFQLSSVGQPLLNQEIGHIDYTCVDVGVPLTEVQIFNDSVLIASTTYSPTSGNISGTFRSPDGSNPLTFFGEPSGQEYTRFRFIVGNLEVHYTVSLQENSGERFVGLGVQDAPNGTAAETFFDVGFWVNESDEVLDGGASYTEGPIMRAAACIESGTIVAPVFSTPEGDCFSPQVPRLPINDAQLQAMSELYQAARAFWLTAANLVEICRSLVPAA